MAQRRKFSAEYKREAVAMLESPGVSVSQIVTELGIRGDCPGTGAPEVALASGSGVSGTWPSAGRGTGSPAARGYRVTKERDFLREAAACFASASR